jgi:opacity protein-like surface antigen
MNINLENIDELFRDNLDTMEIKPSPSVKENVKRGMYYRNLIKKTYFKTGLSIVIISLISTLVFINLNNSSNNKIAQNNNVELKQINSTDLSENSPISNNKNSKSVNNNSKFNAAKNENIISNKTIENKEIENKEIIINNEVEKNVSNFDENSDTPESKVKSNKIETKKLTKSNNIKKDKNINQFIAENNFKNDAVLNSNYKQNTVIENEITADKNVSNKSSVIISSTQNKNLEKRKIESVQKMAYLSPILLNNKNEVFIPVIQIPDDTIGFTVTGEEIITSSNHWFVGLNIAPFYSLSKYSISNEENLVLVDKLNSSSKGNLSYSLGLEAGYNFKNISLISGIYYTQFNEKFNSEYQELSITTENYWEYNNITQTVYDTTSYINIDTLIQGDTNYVQIIDSTQITITDSTQANRNDTSTTNKKMTNINQYSYFEIPLTIEFTFNRVNKFSPFIRTGVIAGLHIKTKGFTYDIENNQELIEANNTPYMKANFWLLLGAGVKYKLNDKISILIYPYYRYNLNSIISDKNYYKQSLNNIGVNFGVKYKF